MTQLEVQSTLNIASIIVIFAGPVLAYAGYHRLRLKRLVQSTPTTKIGALKAGLVEISGKAVSVSSLCDPIYSRPCVYYEVTVQERHRRERRVEDEWATNRGWHTTFKSDSKDKPFFVEDETGRVQIQPQGCELFLESSVEHDATREAWLTGNHPFNPATHERRVTAKFIRPGEPVLALGWAAPAGISGPSNTELARSLKADAAQMLRLDANKDGAIDAEEFDRGMTEARKASQAAAPRAQHAFSITRGMNGPLIIAGSLEAPLVSKMAWTGNLLLLGGPVAALAGVLYQVLK